MASALRRGAWLALAGLAAASAAHAEELLGDDEPVARLEVCYDFGCRSTKAVYVFETEWREVADTFRHVTSAADERLRIAWAIAAVERLVGEVTPTGADRGGNGYDGDDPSGQLDCVDEAANATAYLALFERLGLMTHHRVGEKVYRAPAVLDQHWAARIEERATGREFAVDSWPRDNGEPAVVQPVAGWRRGAAPAPVTAGIVHRTPAQ